MCHLRTKSIFWENDRDRDVLMDLLQENKVVISSTDTVYGFLGVVTRQSYQEISKLKRTPLGKPFILLIASIEKIKHFVKQDKISERMLQFLSLCWPGPVTVIFDAKPGLPSHLVSQEGTIALRCPDHAYLRSFLQHFEGLFSTSANRTMDEAPRIASEILPELLDEVACFISDKKELDKSSSKPSSIIDLSKVSYNFEQKGDKLPFKIVREGAYSIEKLKEIYEKVTKYST